MRPRGALRQPARSCPQQPEARGAARPAEERARRGRAGPGGEPRRVPGEQPPPPREPGAGTLRRSEPKPPGQEPAILELHGSSPGRLEERGSLTCELGQMQEGQGRPPEQELQEVFEDVAVYFTQKEWELLDDDDKMLYRDQMLKNFQALVSLGYQGPIPDLICSIQQGQVGLWVSDDEDCGEISRSEDLLSGGACLLSRTKEQRPAEGPANLEPAWTFLGSLGKMVSLRPEKEPWHKSQGRPQKHKENRVMNQVPSPFERESGEGTDRQSPGCREQFVELRDLKSRWEDPLHPSQGVGKGLGGKQELPAKHKGRAHPCLKVRKVFKCPSLLAFHKISYTGEKPHVCAKCGKSITCLSSLTVHS
ncbi:zinc finger protein 28 homolog [Alligator mississippiensis]|uniref:zinc finger protein 28 homolog n=1 Tax=Alligator mississippiensis TaxID=8496 RepID=UPI002877F1B8|nr:zinc finger protein 28 homolog [Alligator mississippiensis]